MLKHKKILVGLLSLVIITTCFGVETAAAQGGTGTPSTNIFTTTANLAVIFATAMEVLAFMIFHFLQFFLDPLFILELTGSEGLRAIWKYSRDIMNVIFAFMLIFAGIFTVVTGNKELVNSKYKKFILAVVLVNFSWFFPRVILDVANVLTATIYQLPAGLSGGTVDCRLPPKDPRAGGPGEACKIITDVKFFNGCNPPKKPNGDPDPGYITKLGIVCYKTEPWVGNTNTSFGMLNGLVVNYGKLGELTRVINPSATPAAGGTKTDRYKQYLLFLMHIMFIMVLMAMLFLPLAAMFVVFIIRIPIMWVTIAFMPFMFLGFVIGDKMKNFDSMKIFEHYIKAAFLPTVIAVPFAAGFLVLTEITQIPCPAIVRDTTLCADTGPLLTNVNTLWGIFMLLIAFFIIWFGFWAAISIDSIYTNATAGIKNFGSSIGKTALKLPLSVPIPIGGGQNMSVLGMDDAIGRINASLSRGEGPLKSLGAGRPGSSSATSNRALAQAVNSGETNKNLEKIIEKLGQDNAGSNVNESQINVRLEQAFNNNENGIKDKLAAGTTAEQFRDAVKASTSLANTLNKIRNQGGGAAGGTP